MANKLIILVFCFWLLAFSDHLTNYTIFYYIKLGSLGVYFIGIPKFPLQTKQIQIKNEACWIQGRRENLCQNKN